MTSYNSQISTQMLPPGINLIISLTSEIGHYYTLNTTLDDQRL